MASDWTVDTLKEFTLKQLDDMRAEYNQRFAAQQKEVETAFNAAKEAVIKSEIGVEKRSDAVYVTITKLQDALALVMPRAESEQRYATLVDKITEVANKVTTTEGRSSGFDKSWAIFLALAGLAGLVVGFIVK